MSTTHSHFAQRNTNANDITAASIHSRRLILTMQYTELMYAAEGSSITAPNGSLREMRWVVQVGTSWQLSDGHHHGMDTALLRCMQEGCTGVQE